jgi:spore germination protein
VKLKHARYLASLLALFVTVMPAGEVQAASPQRWAYYVPWDSTSLDSLAAYSKYLDFVSPYYFILEPDGSITSMERTSGLPTGAKIVPMIKNRAQYEDFHAQIADSSQRSAIIASLLRIVNRGNYAGIHIDFEGISPQDRPNLTAFMSELAAAFRRFGKMVTMAVAAKTYDATSGWAGAYDYAGLASTVDLVTVMAYDYHYSGSTNPGPVAPIGWVAKVASFAASQFGAGKVLLGIPLYGYDWNIVTGPPAKARRYGDILDLVSRYGGTFAFDDGSKSPYYRYISPDGASHEVWFENSASVQAKIDVASRYGLAGIALWRLGQEDQAIWKIIGALKNPTARIAPFDSTPDRIYFPQTGHSLAYGFLSYWLNNGGLARFGYPVTEEFDEMNTADGKIYTVQYFERARFEYHPEYKGTQYEVLQGLLGREVTANRNFTPVPPVQQSEESVYFSETGHSLSGAFLRYWKSKGGLMQFGYPISEPMQENGYTVQYFERVRMEHHPEFTGTAYEVLLGLLGRELLVGRGWLD